MYDFALVFSLPRHALRPIFMALTREQLASIAELARLELAAAEMVAHQDNLSRILDFVGALDACDTANVPPMAHPLAGLSQRLRPDAVTEGDHHEQYQANAPLAAAG